VVAVLLDRAERDDEQRRLGDVGPHRPGQRSHPRSLGREPDGQGPRMTTEETRKVAELLEDERTGLFTTIAPDGTLVSRPMALQEVEFDGDLWFFAERDSNPVQHIEASPEVNLGAGSGGSWISLTGDAEIVEDAAKKRELWNSAVEAWFPQGPDDDSVVLIKVHADSAEYWDTPGGRLATAFSFAKAKLTGQRIEGGENEKVEL
jgi:general stress protein 26